MDPSLSRHVRPQPGALPQIVRNIDPRIFDVVIAFALTAAALAIIAARSGTETGFRADDVIGIALAVSQTLPLAARRASPLGVLVVMTATLVAHASVGYEVVQAGTFAVFIAVYGAASLTNSRGSVMVAAITLAGLVGFFATTRGEWTVVNISATSGTFLLAWLLGTFVRFRGEQVEMVGARATRLELERDLLAREAVADERARMARELHDIVGHALNVIVIQAAGARQAFNIRPEVPRDALASIDSIGREALVDMERMLEVLSGAGPAGAASDPRPGLGELDGLAAHFSEAGIPVDVVIKGAGPEVPTSVELSAFRIVQESLTNCLKHSGASRATVSIRYGPSDIELEVIDNGLGSTASEHVTSREGRGHLGMRERVALFGGEISMGPLTPAGGYRVWARLPFKGTVA
jgi:signal transduction histidine kinase